jgi:hypothetical protein
MQNSDGVFFIVAVRLRLAVPFLSLVIQRLIDAIGKVLK